jgi:serine/threonine protein kinase
MAGNMPQFPPPDAQTQEVLGIQAVGAHLEDGGFKSVYACTLANGSAAIVSVEAALGNGQAAEAAALDRLSSRPPHPHIVRFIARHVAAPLSYAVYERLQTELFDKVINGRLGEAVARAYFAQVVSGLRHMHRLGVSHRDIKLENIMIDQHNSLRLIDFNLSRVVPTQAPPAAVFGAAQSTDWAGSRSYRAPEVIAGAAHDMFKADVWSLGVVLFTMVTGFFFVDVATVADPRFRRAQMAQQNGLSTVRALYAMYNLPNPLSADLVTLLDGMLAIDAGARLSLDEVCSSQWMSHVGAALHAHDNVWPLSPSLWRLRAQVLSPCLTPPHAHPPPPSPTLPHPPPPSPTLPHPPPPHAHLLPTCLCRLLLAAALLGAPAPPHAAGRRLLAVAARGVCRGDAPARRAGDAGGAGAL